MEINSLERHQMDNLVRIIKSDSFKKNLKEIENYIQLNYEKLHYQWGIKNKLKLAAERLVRFHIWKNSSLVDLYNTPLSSDVAFILDDCVMNIDCKTIDLNGNKNDINYIQCEQNQANFENKPLNGCFIKEVNLEFGGYKFFPILEKFHNSKPVLSYFIFINYNDDGISFKIKGLEICCLPHNDVVKNNFDSDIIQGYKTYKYLKELQAEKFDSYYIPKVNPMEHWIEFKTGKTKRFYDNKMSHPIDSTQPLVWGLVGGKWHVVIGGHTIRVRKSKIKDRIDDHSNPWLGWRKIQL